MATFKLSFVPFVLLRAGDTTELLTEKKSYFWGVEIFLPFQ